MSMDAMQCLRALPRRTGGAKRTALGVLLALGILGILGTIAAAHSKPGSRDIVEATAVAVEARRITSFDRIDADARRFGALDFVGGLVLTSHDRRFGGWSGLTLEPDGRSFLAVSDAGSWMCGTLSYRDGRLSGVADARIGPIRKLDANPLARARDVDGESVRLLSGTLDAGSVLVAFERNHRIGLFPVDKQVLGAPERYLARPPEWSRMRRNAGVEAVAVLAGGPLKGSVVAFAEKLADADGNHTGWIWRGGPGATPQVMHVRRIGDFDLTDAVSLADGTLLILERSFSWARGVKTRMRLVPADAVRPGALLDGPVLIEADMRYDIDNMEALAVHADGDRTILTVMSDDNFNGFLQRTIVLQFALRPERIAALPR